MPNSTQPALVITTKKGTSVFYKAPKQVIIGDVVTGHQTFTFGKDGFTMSTGINTDLTNDEANAFAEFLKRVGYSDFRGLAASDDEAYMMQNAAIKLAKSLADAGFSPR